MSSLFAFSNFYIENFHWNVSKISQLPEGSCIPSQCADFWNQNMLMALSAGVWIILFTKGSSCDFLHSSPTIDSHQDMNTFCPLNCTQKLWDNFWASLLLTSEQEMLMCTLTYKVIPVSFSLSTCPEQIPLFILMFPLDESSRQVFIRFIKS